MLPFGTEATYIVYTHQKLTFWTMKGLSLHLQRAKLIGLKKKSIKQKYKIRRMRALQVVPSPEKVYSEQVRGQNSPIVKISILLIACDKTPSSNILLYGAVTKTKRVEQHHTGARSCVISPDITAQPSFFLLQVYFLYASIQLCVKVCIAWQKF